MFNVGIISQYPSNGDTFFSAMEASAPIGWWKMNETSGSAVADSSGNGYNATGGVFSSANEPFIFSGAGVSRGIANLEQGGVEVTTASANTGLSVTGDMTCQILLIITEADSGFPKLMNKPTDLFTGQSNYQLFLNTSTTKITGRVNISGGYYDVNSTNTYSLGTPYMIHLRRSGTTLSLWINGVLDTSLTVPSSNLDTAATPLYFGRPLGYGTTDDYAGRIQSPAVWNRALSNAEIENLWALRNEA